MPVRAGEEGVSPAAVRHTGVHPPWPGRRQAGYIPKPGPLNPGFVDMQLCVDPNLFKRTLMSSRVRRHLGSAGQV